MKLAEKKYMMNSNGLFRWNAPMRVSMPNMRNKSEKKPISIIFPHQRDATIIFISMGRMFEIDQTGSYLRASRPHVFLKKVIICATA
jgi:hypothetical protein